MSAFTARFPGLRRPVPRLRRLRPSSGITAIVVKELRGRMRGRRAFIILTIHVLLLAVSIPPGRTAPAHVHPWPAVFLTLQPAHLVFRNLAAEVVKEIRPGVDEPVRPKVEWREPDAAPASVTNVGTTEMRALRIEMKLLAR